MIIKLKGSKIRAGKWYEGFITRHFVDKTKGVLKVYVMLDEDVNKGIHVEYLQVIPVETNEHSKFAKFARRMELLTEKGNVDTNRLNELAVKAILNLGKENNFYIGSLKIDYDYYEELEEQCDKEDDNNTEDYD